MSDRIPIDQMHRGVGIHAGQTAERGEIVKAAIDHVLELDDPARLAHYAGEARHPPEARLLAAAKCEAAFQLAAEDRTLRPAIDLTRIRAVTAGLDVAGWRHPFAYCSLLDNDTDAAPRETPLTEEAA